MQIANLLFLDGGLQIGVADIVVRMRQDVDGHLAHGLQRYAIRVRVAADGDVHVHDAFRVDGRSEHVERVNFWSDGLAKALGAVDADDCR